MKDQNCLRLLLLGSLMVALAGCTGSKPAASSAAAFVLHSPTLAGKDALQLDGLFFETAAGRVAVPAELTASHKINGQPWAGKIRLPDGRIVSAPLEDMFPFLDRDELAKNMLIPLWEE